MGKTTKELKKMITRSVFELRNAKEPILPEGARYVNVDHYVENGTSYKRCTLIITSRGCSVPTCTMCPFTNYNFYKTGKEPINPVIQIRESLQKIAAKNLSMIAIYNDGSFFSNKELSSEERMAIIQEVKKMGVKYLMIESLPQFITEKKLVEALEELGDLKLIIGIGLQSANDFVREVCVNTTFSLTEYENAIHLAHKYGVRIKTYVMIKPPFLSETDAYYDVIETAQYLEQFKSLTNMTLCPTRVAENTLVNELYTRNLFSPPDLFTIMACLKESMNYIETRVSTLNITAGDFNSQTAQSFNPKYEKEMIDSLVQFKQTGDTKHLELKDETKMAYDTWLSELKSHKRNNLPNFIEETMLSLNSPVYESH